MPDAELLSKMAEVLEVSVEELLGEPKTQPREDDAVVEQLARINEQLAVKNRRARRIWRIIGIILAALVLLNIIGVVLFSADTKTGPRQESTEIVTETVETGSEP